MAVLCRCPAFLAEKVLFGDRCRRRSSDSLSNKRHLGMAYLASRSASAMMSTDLVGVVIEARRAWFDVYMTQHDSFRRTCPESIVQERSGISWDQAWTGVCHSAICDDRKTCTRYEALRRYLQMCIQTLSISRHVSVEQIQHGDI